MEVIEKLKKTYRSSTDTSSNKYLMVPIFIFFALLIFALIRSPILISQSGIGSAIMLTAPLILTTYALTFIAMAGRGGVDLSIGPFMGFINVSSIQLYAAGYLQTPIGWFVYAIAMGLLWQLFYALIVCFVRVSPIIVSLAGYLAFAGINIVILPRPGGIAPDWLLPWGEGFTILNPIFLLMILATILFYIITHTAFWGHLKLMGSDERAAFTSGVKINLVRIVAHMIAGIFAALSAICFTALVGSGDPLQGTKYTLLGITALVLGGASLVGGRGGAFGAILGALNLYLINYILVTFRFERLQSFVSDLSYGAVLVIALLVSLILPYVTRVTKGLSVMVFFILMAFAGLFVMIHQVYDQPIVVEKVVENNVKSETETRGSIERKVDATGNIIVEDSGNATTGQGTAKGGSLAGHGVVQFNETPGTIVFYIIIGIAFVALLFYLLSAHRSPSTISFVVIVVIMAAGLIFDPDNKENNLLKDTEKITLQSNQVSSIETSAPQYFSLEKINYLPNISEGALISGTAYSIIYFAGVVLLASLIVVAMLPQFSPRTKSTAMLFFLAALSLIILKGISYNNLIENTENSYFGIQGYGVILVVLLLFVITAPFVHSRIKNLTNVYIFGFGILAIISTYFIGGNTFISDDPSLYQSQIINELNIGDLSLVKYEGTKRFFYETATSGYSQVAFSILGVFLIQYFLFLNMGEKANYKRFAPYIYIVILAVALWSSIFYSVGYSFYKILAVLAIGIPITPLVWQFMSIYKEKNARDQQLSQWEEVK
ncbi:ABC transporter permease [Candidatus Pelagibacter sp.]|jgi:ribose transport system permease protein|nr:ABC transporter permease [Candidatus Pelagibacter sp.]MDA9838400.1 ABC transporter permease [Candidatus Pelagibacter sp.]MDC0293476.1 ABC transporter permease [Candidatus Pelagibacter sp.]